MSKSETIAPFITIISSLFIMPTDRQSESIKRENEIRHIFINFQYFSGYSAVFTMRQKLISDYKTKTRKRDAKSKCKSAFLRFT